jgi:hypothetical protein
MLQVGIERQNGSVAMPYRVLESGHQRRSFAAIVRERDVIDLVLFQDAESVVCGTIIDNEEMLVADVLFRASD